MSGKLDDRSSYPKGTGSRVVYEAVQKRILSLKWRPGHEIDEQKLIEEFGVSRTPVREALIWLAADGTVDVVPNRGVWVSQLREEEIPEILEALEFCLRMIHRWAAERRTQADLKHLADHGQAADRAWAWSRVSAIAQAENHFFERVALATRNRFMVEAFSSLLPSFLRLSFALLTRERREKGGLESVRRQCGALRERSIDAITSGEVVRADEGAAEYTALLRRRAAVLSDLVSA
jgi:DNA-binding GntR family transcriptional regulator